MRTVVLLVALVALALPALAGWGGDINPGDGPRLIEEVQRDLVLILKKSGEEKADFVRRFAKRSARGCIEALKRFRNPELQDLFVLLLDHDDWHVKHRALFALEHYWEESTAARAWEFLTHKERRMREKAAITCIKLWDGSHKVAEVDALLAREEDFHVRCCLEALKRRIQGTLPVEKVHEEYILKLDNGLMLAPFLNGMHTLEKTAPGYRPRKLSHTGKGKSGRLAAADRWQTPLLGYREEEVVGASLQPFANLRQDGKVYHVGEDAGACLDGAGFYAPAVGVVRLVHAGSDMGTLIVVEHKLGGGQIVNSVFMHGGDAVFVEAGEHVTCGQLLGTMGMSYSVENGGHFAHLHFGLYPGPFSTTHNYGYKPVKDGLQDWYDPAEFLPSWMERTQPLVDVTRPVAAPLETINKRITRDELGHAYVELVRILKKTLADEAVQRDGEWLLEMLELAPTAAQRRARAWKKAGYPRQALETLETYAARCKGLPDAGQLDEMISAWKADSRFAKALKGEAKVAAAEKKATRQKDPAKMRPTWKKLEKEYGDTCLAVRIERNLDR